MNVDIIIKLINKGAPLFKGFFLTRCFNRILDKWQVSNYFDKKIQQDKKGIINKSIDFLFSNNIQNLIFLTTAITTTILTPINLVLKLVFLMAILTSFLVSWATDLKKVYNMNIINVKKEILEQLKYLDENIIQLEEALNLYINELDITIDENDDIREGEQFKKLNCLKTSILNEALTGHFLINIMLLAISLISGACIPTLILLSANVALDFIDRSFTKSHYYKNFNTVVDEIEKLKEDGASSKESAAAPDSVFTILDMYYVKQAELHALKKILDEKVSVNNERALVTQMFKKYRKDFLENIDFDDKCKDIWSFSKDMLAKGFSCSEYLQLMLHGNFEAVIQNDIELEEMVYFEDKGLVGSYVDL